MLGTIFELLLRWQAKQERVWASTYSDMEDLIPGRLLLFLYVDWHSPTWSCRIHIGNLLYLWHSLRTTDNEQLTVNASGLWAEVPNHVKEEVGAEPADFNREINR